MTSKRICLQPFSWLELQPDGAVFCCCPSWRPQPLGNLLHQSLAEIWQGTPARELRAAIGRGNFHGCRAGSCPHLASRSGSVRPIAELTPAERRQVSRQDRALPEGATRIKLSFDPRCNLGCASCRGGDRPVVPFDAGRVERLQRRVVDELLPVAETLLLAGHGDPFAAPAYRTLLQGLDAGSAPLLRAVHLHTNAQLWTPQAWAELPHLQRLVRSAEISVDAASAATYALNRQGGAFGVLLENLEFIAGLGIEVQLSCVVQASNLHELEAFCDLAERFGFSSYFSRLVNWGTFGRVDYVARAVHLPAHPRHQELIDTLGRISRRPRVVLGNLAPLLAG